MDRQVITYVIIGPSVGIETDRDKPVFGTGRLLGRDTVKAIASRFCPCDEYVIVIEFITVVFVVPITKIETDRICIIVKPNLCGIINR